MSFAIVPAWENKRLLIGESVPVDKKQALRDIIKNGPRVVHTDHSRASYAGSEKLLVALDASFDPELDIEELNDHITKIEDELKAADDRTHFIYIEPEL